MLRGPQPQRCSRWRALQHRLPRPRSPIPNHKGPCHPSSAPFPSVQVLSWRPEVYAPDPVLSALHSLLCELSALDCARQEAAAAGGSCKPASGRPVIDPTPLREAINALPGQEFKMGGWGMGVCGCAPAGAAGLQFSSSMT